MPKASPIQTSFSAGEIAPLVQGRVDSERYKTALAICQNYIPTLQGPLVRRPGTKFIATVKDPSKPPTLFPFQFSQTQSYMLEFGDQYIRFFTNDGQIITSSNSFKVAGSDSAIGAGLFPFTATRNSALAQPGEIITTSTIVAAGSILELVSPYAIADVPQLKMASNADTTYITHPSYPPYKLQRSGATQWAIKPVQTHDGPYLALNSYRTTGDNVLTTLSVLNVGGVFAVFSNPRKQVTGAANNGAGLIRLTSVAHGHVTGDRIGVFGVPGTVEANNNISGSAAFSTMYWIASVPDADHIDLVGSAFVNTCTGSTGSISPALFDPSANNGVDTGDIGRQIALYDAGRRMWGTIIIVDSVVSAQIYISRTNPAVIVNSTVIAFWQMGVYNKTAGYPSACCFHQDRLVFGGAPSYPQQIDASMSASYEDFSASNGSSLQVADNNALQFRLLSAQSNPVQWLKSSPQGLLAGSISTEWQIAPNNQAAALAPTNINATPTSFYGSANIDAVQAGNATLYVQSAQRKLREMNYFFQVGTFRSTDLTELSEHITIPTITRLAVQKEPYPLLWATRSDGGLISMSYNRDDQTIKAGWARHVLGGRSDSAGSPPTVKSIAVVTGSSATFDQLWMTVGRYINGTSVVNVELMSTPYNDSQPQEDAYYLDCGATFDSPNGTITGISLSASSFVSALFPGFANNDTVKITNVIGVNSSVMDIDGNTTITNLVNENTFIAGSVAGSGFNILDFSGNYIDGRTYSPYVSGGQVRKLVSTISGLTWLKGETVGVLADGGIHPDAIVNSAGVLALSYPAAKVQIGYRYNSDASDLRSDAGAADGSSVGKLRRITYAAFVLHQVGDFSFGPSFQRLFPLEITRADTDRADMATPLFSGLTRDGEEGQYDFDDNLCWRQNSALPGMVLSVTTMMDEFDV